MKNSLTQLQYTYNKLKDKNEIAIIEKYNYNAKRFTTVLISKLIITDFAM